MLPFEAPVVLFLDSLFPLWARFFFFRPLSPKGPMPQLNTYYYHLGDVYDEETLPESRM